MLDIGISKLMLVAGIALALIGPERLPKVARMAGTLLGRAQRYVADVKAEVNRSMELDELNKVRREFETAARDVGQSVSSSLDSATGDRIMALMFELNREQGTTLVLVTHDREIARRCERRIVIEAGRARELPAEAG